MKRGGKLDTAIRRLAEELEFDMDELSRDQSGVIYEFLPPQHAFRLYKNLCEVKKFNEWRATEHARRAASSGRA